MTAPSSAPRSRFPRDNGLTLLFAVLFLITLAAQALSGVALYNQQAVSDGVDPVGLLQYVTSSDFAVDVAENWQSEYLQFFLYIVLTAWFVQRGSPESKSPEDIGLESDEDQRVGRSARPDSPRWARASGPRLWIYSNSLGAVMGALFLLSWLAQSIAGVSAFNEQQLRQLQDPVSWGQYLLSPEFWNRTLQNWQSELLAVASMTALSIYLRQRGSPESKPVGAPHAATSVEG
jgi:hypothetical protein